jgi:hypothetical protein
MCKASLCFKQQIKKQLTVKRIIKPHLCMKDKKKILFKKNLEKRGWLNGFSKNNLEKKQRRRQIILLLGNNLWRPK